MDKLIIAKALIAFNKLIIILALSLSPSILLAENTSLKPNVILIVADYMGYSDIEPYGSKDIKTHSLNALASQGLRFLNHYAPPICIPSRASLMSGKYPSKILERFESEKGVGLHSKNNNLLSALKASDYQTALVGKCHLGVEKNFSPIGHGFDYFFGFNDWALGNPSLSD